MFTSFLFRLLVVLIFLNVIAKTRALCGGGTDCNAGSYCFNNQYCTQCYSGSYSSSSGATSCTTCPSTGSSAQQYRATSPYLRVRPVRQVNIIMVILAKHVILVVIYHLQGRHHVLFVHLRDHPHNSIVLLPHLRVRPVRQVNIMEAYLLRPSLTFHVHSEVQNRHQPRMLTSWNVAPHLSPRTQQNSTQNRRLLQQTRHRQPHRQLHRPPRPSLPIPHDVPEITFLTYFVNYIFVIYSDRYFLGKFDLRYFL